jgi:hypothetical protein
MTIGRPVPRGDEVDHVLTDEEARVLALSGKVGPRDPEAPLPGKDLTAVHLETGETLAEIEARIVEQVELVSPDTLQ